MPRLRRVSGRDVREILERHGFMLASQRGSHMIMPRTVQGSTITVPVPDHKELRQGTPLPIIRQSGLPRTLFETE